MSDDAPGCPLPFTRYERITLAHGGGGRVTHQLVEGLFRPAFESPELERAHDGAQLDIGGQLTVTTDAFTVRPLFFPGGDIGSLAVHGTTNDLAVSGAIPRYLTASFVLEEGLPMSDLERIVHSMASAARRSGVRVVAGDTKVVERGKGDGVYISTAGIGETIADIGPERVREGDSVIVSGPIGEHGIAVLLAREGLPLPDGLVSDAADIAPAVRALVEAVDVHCLRDPTRGGMGTVVAEIAERSGFEVVVDEAAIPTRPEVADACELLGLDPLYVACEGRFVAFVEGAHAEQALSVMRRFGGAEVVGRVRSGRGRALLRTRFGSERALDVPSGEQLPRIC